MKSLNLKVKTLRGFQILRTNQYMFVVRGLARRVHDQARAKKGQHQSLKGLRKGRKAIRNLAADLDQEMVTGPDQDQVLTRGPRTKNKTNSYPVVGVGLVLGEGLDHSQETKEELQAREVVMSPKMGLP